jgi:hypothetical protein
MTSVTGSDSSCSDDDPLLAEIRKARRRKLRAEQDLRTLIAYGREFVKPRPYRLADLAEAAGISVSGVRTSYDHRDVIRVADLLEQAARIAVPDA